ncbi:MAG: dirigent protein [Pyrinomonadaceae bacterium]|nr:dirigent protein [Pyrinomonadaceae bacterium]
MSHKRKIAFTVVVLFTICLTTRTAKLAPLDQTSEALPTLTQEPKRRVECTSVSGTAMTNFISEDTTLGIATGDLKGGVSASLLKITPGPNGKLFFDVQHTFVTEAGDTMRIAVSTAEGTLISEGIYYVAFQPQLIVGGTGKFTGASGQIISRGSVDLTRGETVFRYFGEICH